jgi:hypothetical protein
VRPCFKKTGKREKKSIRTQTHGGERPCEGKERRCFLYAKEKEVRMKPTP